MSISIRNAKLINQTYHTITKDGHTDRPFSLVIIEVIALQITHRAVCYKLYLTMPEIKSFLVLFFKKEQKYK